MKAVRDGGNYLVVDDGGKTVGSVRREQNRYDFVASADHQEIEFPVRSVQEGVEYVEQARDEWRQQNQLPRVYEGYNLGFAQQVARNMRAEYRNCDIRRVLWAVLLLAGGTLSPECVRERQEFLAAVSAAWDRLGDKEPDSEATKA